MNDTDPSSQAGNELAAPAAVTRNRGVMPMERDDLPAVGRIFNKAFRQREADAGDDLLAYLDHIYFGNPDYSAENGSIVHRNTKSVIDAALLSLPIPFQVGDRQITGRLMGGFMADGKAGFAGAARIVHSIRISKPDLCYADNASPVSADHWVVSGAALLPVQSLAWRRVFSPAAAETLRLSGRLPALSRLPVATALKPVDALARRLSSAFAPPQPKGTTSAAADLDTFSECFETMTERFAVRPHWPRAHLRWIIDAAALNTTLGTFETRTVSDAKGELIGAYAFFSRPGGVAEVMNTLTVKGREFDVTGQMFVDLYQAGHVAARGMAQPVLMNALMRQRQLGFSYRGYLCLLTRHDDLRDAAMRGDIFIGGLASEAWNRLMTDFA